jgi:hypothetical protein
MKSIGEIQGAGHGFATGQVRQVLRGEALAMFGASTTLFVLFGGELWLFAMLFFVPDLSIAAYAAGSKAGALVYNTVHSYALPATLSLAGVLSHLEIVWQIGLIFVAHAAFDRSLGYGLKYAAGFRHTHLGPIGKPAPDDD